MRIRLIYLYFCFILCDITSCKEENKKWQNIQFKEAIDYYCKYVDSIGYKQNYEYIYVEAKRNNDSIVFLIYLCGGAYDFLVNRENIIDFFYYKRFEIMLVGDFPNEVVNIEKNKKLNLFKIAKARYPRDYNKYLNDSLSVGPLIYDTKNMTLIFKEGKLVNSKFQY
jgi:hypothetical protein